MTWTSRPGGKKWGSLLLGVLATHVLIFGQTAWGGDRTDDSPTIAPEDVAAPQVKVLRPPGGGFSWADDAVAAESADDSLMPQPLDERLAMYQEGAAPDAGRANPTEPREPLGQAPEDTSLLFLRRATVLLGPGHMDVDFGIRYTWQETQRATLVPAPRLVDTERLRYRQIYVPLAVRYGLTRRSQLYCNLPVGGSISELSHPFSDAFDGTGGLGDVSAGITCQLFEHRPLRPDWILSVGFVAPTGKAQFHSLGIPFGFLEPLPVYMGQGFWAASASLNFVYSIDPVVLFGGVGYTHEFDRSYLGLDFQPGEAFSYQFGIGFAVNDRITLSTVAFSTIQTTWTANGMGLPSSSQEPFALRFAATISASRIWIVEPFIAVGMNDDAPDSDLGVTFTRRF